MLCSTRENGEGTGGLCSAAPGEGRGEGFVLWSTRENGGEQGGCALHYGKTQNARGCPMGKHRAHPDKVNRPPKTLKHSNTKL